MDTDGGGDDQFYGDEEDYDDLYNDVNVGEGFHHSLAGETPVADQVQPPLPAVLPPAPAVVAASDQKVQIQGGVAGDSKMERANQAVPAPPVAQPPPPPQAAPGNPHEAFQRQVPMAVPHGVNGVGVDGGAGTTLFVGELHWWTTDADLEVELSKFGQVKEVRFFDEKASGKSKGYCQVDFYDPMVATACKEALNGHPFNGRPCVVAYANPHTVRRMGEQQVKNQQVMGGPQSSALTQKQGVGPTNMAGGTNNNNNNFGRGNMGGGMAGNNNNNFGRGGMMGGNNNNNWGGRGNMGNRGPMGMRNNRMGPVGGRGLMGNGGMVGPPPPMLHPGAMMGQGFDPTGYGAMGRMGAGFGGFPGGPGSGPFPGMMPSFPPVVAPHVNPAFFGRGGMGGAGPGGMWPDPNMGGPAWGEDHQSSYGDDAGSDHQYEGSLGKERGQVAERDYPENNNNNNNNGNGAGRREKEYREKEVKEDWPEQRRQRGGEDREMRERDWEGERDGGGERERERERERPRERERERERERPRERERERDRERDRYREDRDHHYSRHRSERENDDWDRGKSSARSKSREVEHSKRRRVSPE